MNPRNKENRQAEPHELKGDNADAGRAAPLIARTHELLILTSAETVWAHIIGGTCGYQA